MEQYQYIIWSLMCINLIYYTVIFWKHIQFRSLFPIAERSWKLSLTNGIGSMIYLTVLYTSTLIVLNKSQNEIQNLSQSPALYCQNVYPSQNRFTSLEILSAVNNFARFLEVFSYFFRTYRLCYVFGVALNKKRISSTAPNSLGFTSDITSSQQSPVQGTLASQIQHHDQHYQISHNNNNHYFTLSNNQTENHHMTNTQEQTQARRLHNEQSILTIFENNQTESLHSQIKQKKLYSLLQNENYLVIISIVLSTIMAYVFYLRSEYSPFIFWYLGSQMDYSYVAFILCSCYFCLILAILWCFNSMQIVPNSYGIRFEIYFVLAIFTVFGNVMLFYCYDETNYEQLKGFILTKLYVSAFLDFVAINYTILIPILRSSNTRDWLVQILVQDDINFFAAKYHNFNDYLLSKKRETETPILENYLSNILQLFLKMLEFERINEKIQAAADVFNDYPELINVFEQIREPLGQLFIIQTDNQGITCIKPQPIVRNTQSFTILYQKVVEILVNQQMQFKRTPQYEILDQRIQSLVSVKLTFDRFKMLGNQ